MEILLVNPPHARYMHKKELVPPLGLAYIAAVLEESGFSVRIFDMPILNMDLMDLKKELQSTKYGIVGITSGSFNFKQAVEIANLVKSVNLETTVVAGGVHSSFTVNQILGRYPEFNVVVRGEGEYTMLSLASALDQKRSLNKILGISYREDKKIFHNPDRSLIEDVDSLPFPARHLLPLESYLKTIETMPLVACRGCSCSCAFCSIPSFWKNKCRPRNPEGIVDEMEYIRTSYRCRSQTLIGDAFTYDTKVAIGICDELLERGLDISWICYGLINTVTRELLRKLKKAGCKQIVFGLEASSQKVLDMINKQTTIKRTAKVLRWARQEGLTVQGDFLIGLPGDTFQSVRKTIEWSKKHVDVPVFRILHPLPGSDITENAEKYGIRIKDPRWWEGDYQIPLIETENLTSEDIQTLFMEACLSLYK